ncbi:hypothetical protein QJS10_CPB21g01536 [Acorus calamus]|uniref:Uncharacterized protein n=1 Tax=Acorus calamus TaxID=4465 RepID=A0AAV9C5C4_ACOCL|nr:hypothetical protein QJS10_CPB21g01536 [Acorus calamus]
MKTALPQPHCLRAVLPDAKGDITFYAVLMDSLIDTPTDVNVLHREGVLRIGLSSEKEAAQFFNSLCKEVIYERSQSKLFIDLNRYCDSKWHRWRTVLARDYFSSPWAAISVLAAFILLLLTLLQTVYTMNRLGAANGGCDSVHGPLITGPSHRTVGLRLEERSQGVCGGECR